MEDVNQAVTGRREQQTCLGIISVGVYATADRERLYDFPSIGIHDYKELRIATRDEQTPVLSVHCHRGRGSGGSDGPPRLNRTASRIDNQDLVRVEIIVVNHSLAVSDSRFRSPP